MHFQMFITTIRSCTNNLSFHPSLRHFAAKSTVQRSTVIHAQVQQSDSQQRDVMDLQQAKFVSTRGHSPYPSPSRHDATRRTHYDFSLADRVRSNRSMLRLGPVDLLPLLLPATESSHGLPTGLASLLPSDISAPRPTCARPLETDSFAGTLLSPDTSLCWRGDTWRTLRVGAVRDAAGPTNWLRYGDERGSAENALACEEGGDEERGKQACSRLTPLGRRIGAAPPKIDPVAPAARLQSLSPARRGRSALACALFTSGVVLLHVRRTLDDSRSSSLDSLHASSVTGELVRRCDSRASKLPRNGLS
jgi:hypothetical protein